MLTGFDVRLRRHIIDGDPADVILCNGLTVTVPIDAAAGLQAPVSTVVYGDLPDFLEVALEYWNGTAWVEPDRCRFIITGDDDNARDPAGMHTLAGVELWPWFLERAIVEMPADPGDLTDGHRPFNSATPGAILKTLIDEGQALGWGPSLSYDFDADDDSNGDPWDSQLTIAYKPGTDVWTVLSNLLDQGVVEMVTEGRALHLFNPEHGVDRSGGNTPVRIAYHADTQPTRKSIDDLITDVSLYGDNGYTLDLNNPSAPTTLGRLVKAIQQGGVSDPGTATLLAQAELTKGSQIRQQITASEAAASALFLPWIDYQVGDWVEAWFRGDWEPLRIPELVVSKQDGKVTVSPVLNDRFINMLTQMAKRTNGIRGGAVAGGTGAVPSEPGDDNRQPKAPTGLVLESTGYWSQATPLSQVAAEWAAVTQAVDDVAIEISGYELWGRLDDGADESDQQTASLTTAATWSPYTPDDEWLFKVRAISKTGVPGVFSDEVSVTMLNPDQVVTAAPTIPNLSTNNGIVTVSWDGLLDTTPTSAPPSHFRQIEIQMSAEETDGYLRAGTLFIGNQRAVFSGIAVGSTAWFRFVWVDNLGRLSDPSDPASVVVAGISGADIVANSIEVNRLQVGSITVDYLDAGLSEQITLSAETIVLQGGQIAALSNDLDDTAADLADLRLYVVIDGTEVSITRPDSDNSFALSNDRAAMRQSGIDVSWWEAGVFNVPNLVATVASIGPVKFETDPDGTGLAARRL